jgi:hypothetical protein
VPAKRRDEGVGAEVGRPVDDAEARSQLVDAVERPPGPWTAASVTGYNGTMTTFTDRPATALLVVDVQQGVVEGAYRRDEVVANVATLVERARAASVPVVWVQHEDGGLVRDSAPWALVPELSPAPEEPVVHKRFGDAFEATGLEDVLAALAVGRLVVAGAQTDACIRSTLHGAIVRGYDALLVSDAHTTEDQTAWGAPPPDAVIAHTNLYWQFQTAPGRVGSVAATAEVEFGSG